MLLFIFDKDVQPGDRAPFRFRHTPTTMSIPTPSASDNHGPLSKADDAAREVDAFLHRAELARQGAVEEQRRQAMDGGPDQDLRLDLSAITHDGLRQAGQLMARPLTGLHDLRKALGIADVGTEHHPEHPGVT